MKTELENNNKKENISSVKLSQFNKTKKMNPFKKIEPYFGSIGILIAIIAIIVPLIYSNLKSENKEITLRYLSKISLIDINEDVRDKIEISFQNEKVVNLSKIVVSLTNTGNKAILKNDIVLPFKINFISNIEIISYNITKRTPNNLIVDLLKDKLSKELIINFDLLNPNDFVELELYIVGNLKEYPKLDGRIIEGKTITENIIKSKNISEKNSFILKIGRIIETIIYLILILIGIIILFGGLLITIQSVDYYKRENKEIENKELKDYSYFKAFYGKLNLLKGELSKKRDIDLLFTIAASALGYFQVFKEYESNKLNISKEIIIKTDYKLSALVRIYDKLENKPDYDPIVLTNDILHEWEDNIIIGTKLLKKRRSIFKLLIQMISSLIIALIGLLQIIYFIYNKIL